MNKELILNKKSIMYKIISLGYPVYIGDDDEEFLVSVLLCSNCKEIWSMSRRECMFCGTENPHIYECRVCGNKYSITRSSPDCCGEKLVKVCINNDCVTNTDEIIKKFYDNFGGVFQIGKNGPGATLNEMRCKKCGSTINEYKSFLIKLVDDVSCFVEPDKYYLNKKGENDFEVKYNGIIKEYGTLEEFIKDAIK